MGHPRRKHNPQLKARTTRSSRGRLLSLSDPAQTSQRLDDQLRSLGLYAAPTLGDGNCLFRALSDQLYGTDSKHAPLRQLICDWIQRHQSRYEPFVEDERGIDTHLRCMRENATYGGHMELSAFAHMAQRNVKVVQPGLVYVIEWQAFPVSSSPTAPAPPFPDMEDLDADDDPDHSTIYVAYHDWEHFSSIRNLKGPHVGLPRVKERPVAQTDLPPSPVAEQYKPAKDRKKAGKERDRQRNQQKREKAREKAKSTLKGKQVALLTESESDLDDDDLSEPEVSPEKLKIKLKLTPNSNNDSNSNNNSHSPSSSLSNISEAENSQPPRKTGLKLRLPPSRSLSLAPSNVSTPPNSQASSTTTLLNTTVSPPHPTISDIYPSMAEALPHANPPTHTSAPHLISNSRESSPGGGHRTNRSPKRTFEESELEDLHSMNGRGVRSRLRGPSHCDGEELEVVESLVDDDDNNDHDDDDDEEDNITTATTTTTTTTTATTSSSALSSPEQSPPPPSEQSSLSLPHNTLSASSPSHIHEPSDDTIMTSPTTPTASVSHNNNPDTLPQKSTKKTPRKHQHRPPSSNPPSSPSPPTQTPSSSPPMTRQQKKREALNNSPHNNNNHPPHHNNTDRDGGGGRMLTRRQRKALGLPKVRRRMVGPYDRNDGKDEGGGDTGGEWKKNGTGRVDVRGFRELKI